MLKQYSVLTGAFIAATMLSAPASAENKDFEQLYIFGNSISDTGNLLSLTSQAGNPFPPPSLYFDGRFSDGPIWVDFLAEDSKLGLTPGNFYEGDPSKLSEGINFALGGATTGTTTLGDIVDEVDPTKSVLLPGVKTQVNTFLNPVLQGNPIDEDALIIYWAGENDYVEEFLSSGNLLNPEIPVNNIKNSLTQLAEAGAKNIVVANIVDFSTVPLGQALVPNPTDLDQLTDAHNSLLNSAVNSLETEFTDTNFMTFDVNGLLNNVINNPASFGLDLAGEPLDSCLTPDNFPNFEPNGPGAVTICDDPDRYIYYDNQHYTSKVQSIIADNLFEAIEEGMNNNPNTTVPEAGNTIGIIGLGLGMLTLWNRKKAHFSK